MAESVTCPECKKTSFHPEDVKQKYCGNCHEFHDFLKMKKTLIPEDKISYTDAWHQLSDQIAKKAHNLSDEKMQEAFAEVLVMMFNLNPEHTYITNEIK